MEDKRELANQELKQTMEGGLLSLSPSRSENFIELPPTPENEVAPSSAGSVFNNFNVNVSVNGGSNTTIEKTSKSIQNALPTTLEIPDLLKKNSPTLLQENSGKERSEQLRGVVNEETPPSSLDITKKTIEETNPISSIQLMGLDLVEDGDVAKYDYSQSELQDNNARAKNDHQVVQNIINHAMTNQNITNISPSSTIDSSLYVNFSAQDKKINEIPNLQVETNRQNPIDTANEAVRNQQRVEQSQQIQTESVANKIKKDNELKKTTDGDVQEAATITAKLGSGPGTVNSKKSQSSRNINATPDTIPLFVNKMNSPPIWRTVLG